MTSRHRFNGKLSKLKHLHSLGRAVSFNVERSAVNKVTFFSNVHILICIFIPTAISFEWILLGIKMFYFDSSALPCILNRNLTVVHSFLLAQISVWIRDVGAHSGGTGHQIEPNGGGIALVQRLCHPWPFTLPFGFSLNDWNIEKCSLK